MSVCVIVARYSRRSLSQSLICTDCCAWQFMRTYFNWMFLATFLQSHPWVNCWNIHGTVEDCLCSTFSFGSFQHRLHFLNFVPGLEIVLSVDCILSASTIKLFRVIWQGSHTRFMTSFRFHAFSNDSIVGWPLVTRPVAWTLIKYVISLTHLQWLVKLHISSPVNLSICSIDFKASNKFQIVSVIFKSFWVLCQTHIIRLLWSCLSINRSLIIFNVCIPDTIRGHWAFLRPSKVWRSATILPSQWILSTTHILIQCPICVSCLIGVHKDAVFNFRDSIVSILFVCDFSQGWFLW